MNMEDNPIKLTPQQQRILKLLFKFRFVSAKLLAQVLKIRTDSTYEVLERLVTSGLVVKVYDKSYRIDRKAAYYYLSKPGVTRVRKQLDVKESVVHTLYKNDVASPEFIEHSLEVLACYSSIKRNLSDGADVFTKSEINRFKQFPKNRPDLFARTPSGKEAMVIFAHDIAPALINKKLDEIITHSEDEGWDGTYPRIAFVLKDDRSKQAFLYKTAEKLEGMGIDEEELTIIAASINAIRDCNNMPWASVYGPKDPISLLE
jgi:predicted transcriptional regulator